jgi:23S rRNA (adenine2503-C2)-methyltransferase
MPTPPLPPPQHLHEQQAELSALGALPLHRARVFRAWAQARALDAGKRLPEHFFPLPLLKALPDLAQRWQQIARLQSAHPAGDGAERLLIALHDGQTVETVLLPRQGVCVSTQVGCAVGCRFCMTGTLGLLRQLGSAEIVAQVVLARQRQALRKVVFMGMGEPAHNLDAVLAAIQFLGAEGGFAHKQLVFSTVGDERVFERLPRERVQPALALSLHSMNAQRRADLLPRAPVWEPAVLVERAMAYAHSSAYPLQVQWTLLDGVNDGADEVAALAKAFARRKAIVNLIPYNHVDGLPAGLRFQRPAIERVVEMARQLTRAGVLTRLRHSAGQEVDAGCGQLRVRAASADAAKAVVILQPLRRIHHHDRA